MIRELWYELLRAYISFGLRFYFKDIIVVGKEKLPKGKPIIFLSNHQNAFLDALLIVTTNMGKIHFLTRSEVFGKKFYRWILSTMRMIPIYRIRDGWDSLEKNAETFRLCNEAFSKGECVLLFPEGNHDQRRRVRPLSRGFTKIAFGAQAQQTDLDLQIVPVGINYEHHHNFFKRVSIYYGDPIAVKAYHEETNGANLLREKVSEELKDLIVHIDDLPNHDEILKRIESSDLDLCDPVKVNQVLTDNNWSASEGTKKTKSGLVDVLFFPFRIVFIILNFLPMSIWKSIRKKIKDPVMVTSIKVGVGIFIFPIMYLLQSLVVLVFTNALIALGFLLVCIVSLPLTSLIDNR